MTMTALHDLLGQLLLATEPELRNALIDAAGATSPEAAARCGGRIGGILRRLRQRARLLVARHAADALDLDTTQWVGDRLMRRLFGCAATTAELRQHFADAAHGYGDRLMPAALTRIEDGASQSVLDEHAALFAAFDDHLREFARALRKQLMDEARPTQAARAA